MITNWIADLKTFVLGLIAAFGLTEHNALLLALGALAALLIFSGRGHIRHHYGRFRNYYNRRYRRGYDDY